VTTRVCSSENLATHTSVYLPTVTPPYRSNGQVIATDSPTNLFLWLGAAPTVLTLPTIVYNSLQQLIASRRA